MHTDGINSVDKSATSLKQSRKTKIAHEIESETPLKHQENDHDR